MPESSSFLGWALGILLVSVRLAMPFIAVPPFAGIPVPALARLLLVLALATCLAGGLGLSIANIDGAFLISLVLHEAVIGAAIAAGLFSAFAAFQFAGRLLDFQIGFGIANLVDIATRNNGPLLGGLLSMAAAVFFFAIGGHLALLRLLHISLQKIPPGSGLQSLDIGAVISQFGTCFSFGFVIVAPVVLCLFLVDIGMSFLSRTMPQMNVFVMSMALKVLVGLAVLAIAVPFAGAAMRLVFESMFSAWSRMVQ